MRVGVRNMRKNHEGWGTRRGRVLKKNKAHAHASAGAAMVRLRKESEEGRGGETCEMRDDGG